MHCYAQKSLISLILLLSASQSALADGGSGNDQYYVVVTDGAQYNRADSDVGARYHCSQFGKEAIFSKHSSEFDEKNKGYSYFLIYECKSTDSASSSKNNGPETSECGRMDWGVKPGCPAASSSEAGQLAQLAAQEPPKIDVAASQHDLAQLGFSIGTPDGVMGPKTVQAIRNYQRLRGLPETGILSAELAGQIHKDLYGPSQRELELERLARNLQQERERIERDRARLEQERAQAEYERQIRDRQDYENQVAIEQARARSAEEERRAAAWRGFANVINQWNQSQHTMQPGPIQLEPFSVRTNCTPTFGGGMTCINW